ncbi:4890_t:CDS:1, partial [Racocetra fulgida]
LSSSKENLILKEASKIVSIFYDSYSESYLCIIHYMAPEVLLGQKFTEATNIYSFEAITSEISSGQRPSD